jgi:prepilin-type N-terminal cleavage/methylation domain-containing protein
MMSVSSERQIAWRQRAAFTLVELLVVLAIALIIISLVAAGTLQVIGYQRTSNTETLIRTLMPPLNQQWKAIVDMVKNEPIPQHVQNMASVTLGVPGPNDDRRARIIWTKLRLKQLLPMNFSEALFPWRLPPQYYNPPFTDAMTVNYILAPGDLPANPTYQTVLNNAGITLGSPVPGAWSAEASPMLLLALQQAYNSSASRFDQDNLPPAALGTSSAGNGTLKMFIDAWQQPLVFYRWPAGNAEVDASNPAGPSVAFRDPLDPDGLLQDPAWNNWGNYSSMAGVFWFEQYCHPVHQGSGSPGYTAQSYYVVPVIVSAGRNNSLGLAPLPMPGPPFPIAPASPFLPDIMAPDGTGADGDNINSFLLRQGARGD